jgi:outer membrane protein TolC
MRDRAPVLATTLATLLAGALVVAPAGPAWAQPAPVLRLTLADAQARAVSASHRLAEARAGEMAARAGVAVSRAGGRPAVDLLGGYTRTNHVVEFSVPSPAGPSRVLYPDVPDNYSSRLDLRWPIYSGGRLQALERAAAAEADAAGADVAAARADLRLEVSRAFWALVTARATVGVIEEGVARSQAHVRDVREQFDAGLVPPNEIASAEVQESRARMLAIEARNQRDAASADLARLVGVDLFQPLEPQAALDESIEPLDDAGATTAAVEALLAEARVERQDRRSMELRLDAAGERRDVAASGRMPTVTVAAGVDYARPNPRIFPRADRWEDSWDAGVSVRLPLWDGGRTGAETARADAELDVFRSRLAEFDSLLALDVRQRVLEIESGRAAVAAADDAVRAATEARRVVDERYRAGVLSQIEVLDAELALLQAGLDRTRALAGVRLAEARLDRTLGR